MTERSNKSDDEYEEVFSSWSLIETTGVKPVVADDVAPRDNPETKDDVRFRVQQKRIERCMSLKDVAVAIGCDERVLTSFERGQLLLRPEVIDKLRKLLKF
jgi:ribosome-binding protein aMBF1 (putative translation factor)